MAILNGSNTLPITEKLFDQDALIFEGLQSSFLCLRQGTKKYLTFHFAGFPYLGIWSKNQASPFVCIEPWYGIADRADTDQDFTNKEGMIKLDQSGIFEASYQVEIHD